MPNLPTIFVTDQQAQRLLAIFGDADAYRAWLKDTLKTHVITQERHRVERGARARREAEIAQAVTDLFPEDVTP